MANKRHDLVPAENWRYLGPAFQGIDQDLTSLETSATSGNDTDDIIPLLPPMKLPTRGTIRTVNRVRMNTSAQYPDPLSWSEDSLLKIIVQNPADSGQNASFGYGLYGNPNNQGTPDVVTPGKEWVGSASSLPIFGRMATTAQANLVITERTA